MRGSSDARMRRAGPGPVEVGHVDVEQHEPDRPPLLEHLERLLARRHGDRGDTEAGELAHDEVAAGPLSSTTSTVAMSTVGSSSTSSTSRDAAPEISGRRSWKRNVEPSPTVLATWM